MSELVSSAVLAKAREEIDAMVSGMVPEGKRGAVVAIFTPDGAQIGIAAKVLGDDLIVDAMLLQRWKSEKPTAQVRVRWTW
jgi:hypothetical protein